MNGVFTISQNGFYKVNWWVATQSGLGQQGINITLVASDGERFISTSPIKSGEVNGMALLNITNAPITFQLLNQSDGVVNYSTGTSVVANCLVYRVIHGCRG